MVKRCTRISLSSCVNGSSNIKSMHHHQPTNHHHPLIAKDCWQCHGTLNWQFHWMTVSIKFIWKPLNFLKLRLLRPQVVKMAIPTIFCMQTKRGTTKSDGKECSFSSNGLLHSIHQNYFQWLSFPTCIYFELRRIIK